MKTIVITGDSWSAGVWGENSVGKYDILAPGLSSLFMNQGYKVINLSQPGSDPWGILWPLNCFIWTNPHIDIKKIYYFQTDIGRSFSNREVPLQKYGGNLTKTLESMYRDLYHALDQLAKQRNIKISVVGGLTDVTVSLNEFDSLELDIPSWCRLLDTSLPLTNLVDKEGFEVLDRQFPDLKDQINKYLDRANARRDFLLSNKQFFYPDGLHPNVNGHRLLFENLIKNI